MSEEFKGLHQLPAVDDLQGRFVMTRPETPVDPERDRLVDPDLVPRFLRAIEMEDLLTLGSDTVLSDAGRVVSLAGYTLTANAPLAGRLVLIGPGTVDGDLLAAPVTLVDGDVADVLSDGSSLKFAGLDLRVVRGDRPQSLTSGEQAQARWNVGATAVGDSVFTAADAEAARQSIAADPRLYQDLTVTDNVSGFANVGVEAFERVVVPDATVVAGVRLTPAPAASYKGRATTIRSPHQDLVVYNSDYSKSWDLPVNGVRVFRYLGGDDWGVEGYHDNSVKLSGDQTIADQKTFSTAPISTGTPTGDTQIANKEQSNALTKTLAGHGAGTVRQKSASIAAGATSTINFNISELLDNANDFGGLFEIWVIGPFNPSHADGDPEPAKGVIRIVGSFDMPPIALDVENLDAAQSDLVASANISVTAISDAGGDIAITIQNNHATDTFDFKARIIRAHGISDSESALGY